MQIIEFTEYVMQSILVVEDDRALNQLMYAYLSDNGYKPVACYDGERLCGVAIAGQPVARKLDDGLTVEIRRVCTDGTKNACSILYGACARVARDMGYKRVITYTLVSENGASLKASGFMNCGEAGGVSWNMPSRPREIVQVTLFGEERKYPDEKKIRWEKHYQ